MKNIKWKALTTLILIILVVLFDLSWGWGVIFLLWMIPDLLTGVTFLTEPVEKKENPFTYWSILFTWLVLSLFLFVDAFTPQLLPKGWSSQDATTYVSQQKGEYYIDYTQHNNKKQDTLFYKDYLSQEFNIVGISALTTYNNNEYDVTLKELWDYFYKNDIAQVIPNILDSNVYVIQSDFDKSKKGYFNLTIGYKTSSLDNIYKGLKGIVVQKSKYAVVELDNSPLKQLQLAWEKLALSDLKTTNLNNVEVYHYNKNNEINKIDIWVATPTSKSELAAIAKKETSPQKTLAPTIVTVSKKETPYQNSFIEPEIIEKVDSKTPKTTKSTSIHPKLTVVGLQAKVDYKDNKAMASTIEKLWTDFFKKDYSKFIGDIKNYEDVYLTYTGYTDNEVTITLGYSSRTTQNFKKNKGLAVVQIDKNEYYNFPLSGKSSDFEGEEWNTLLEVLQYRAASSSDFEIYKFDKKYNVTDAQMWVGAK